MNWRPLGTEKMRVLLGNHEGPSEIFDSCKTHHDDLHQRDWLKIFFQIRTHIFEDKISPFFCDRCDYTTFTKHHLLRHVRNHTLTGLSQLFYCVRCGKFFAHKVNVEGHESRCKSKPWRCEEEKFNCSLCEKVCTTAGILRHHILTNHEPKHPCNICGKWVSFRGENERAEEVTKAEATKDETPTK